MRNGIGQKRAWNPPSESMLLRAVGGMTDTLHRPSGHLVTKDSLHAVCTWNKNPRITRGHSLLHIWPTVAGGMGCSHRGTDRIQERATLTHHGLAPQAAPVLQTQHAATGLVTHRALGTHRQISFQPLVRHGNLQTKQRHALGTCPSTPHRGTEDLGQRCSKMTSTKTRFSPQAEGEQGCPTHTPTPGHSMTHRDWTELGSTKAHSEPPNAEWEQLKTSRKRTEGEESHNSLTSAPLHTPSSSSMMSFPMEASVVHLQLLVARTAHRLWALNLHTVRE